MDLYSQLKALTVNCIDERLSCHSYASLIGFNNLWRLKAAQRRWTPTQETSLSICESCSSFFFVDSSFFCVSGNKNGNRRTANIRSVGYSDLFVLSKEDLWEALQEYPEARRTLIEKGRQLLRKDNLLDEEVAKRQDMEQVSVEQKVDALESIFENVNIRLDRLMVEFEAMQVDIDERLLGVEDKLSHNQTLQ